MDGRTPFAHHPASCSGRFGAARARSCSVAAAGAHQTRAPSSHRRRRRYHSSALGVRIRRNSDSAAVVRSAITRTHRDVFTFYTLNTHHQHTYSPPDTPIHTHTHTLTHGTVSVSRFRLIFRHYIVCRGQNDSCRAAPPFSIYNKRIPIFTLLTGARACVYTYYNTIQL